jgi:pimeloyl-ACP methyl ester carboxylesterase
MAERPPIVFLPGIMGSRLYFQRSGKFWDPDSTWRMLRWMPVSPVRSDDDNRHELHAREPAGVVIDPLDAASPTPDEVRLGWGGVVWSYYADFLRLLRQCAGKGNAFAVGYDWRQDIRWLAEYVTEKLWGALKVTGADRLVLVTHSMGGLVARAALLHDPNLINRVSLFLSICQPAVGAIVLYRRLFTGLVRGLDGGGGIADRAFRLLLGSSRAGFVGNMSGLPGAMQLLPSAHFPADAGGQPWNGSIKGSLTHDQLYGDAQSPPGVLDAALGLPADAQTDMADRLHNVADFHAWLGAPAPLPQTWPKAWSACGLGKDTEVRIGFNGAAANPSVTFDGDGTVPVLSARAFGVAANQRVEVMGLEHGTACLHPEVLKLARQLLA